jgi:hypothetical protein
MSRSRLDEEILLNTGARFHYVDENAFDEGMRLPLIWETSFNIFAKDKRREFAAKEVIGVRIMAALLWT